MKNKSGQTSELSKNISLSLVGLGKQSLLVFSVMLITACGGGSGGDPQPIPSTWVKRLPHSGINSSQCYEAGNNNLVMCSSTAATSLNAQQDGHRANINPMSYSKVGFNGESLAVGATSWCAVKDNVSGLLWQNHQSAPSTHSNFGDNRTGDASKYAADNAILCGLSGWRLPTVDELQSIVDYGVISPRINILWFANTPGNWYWSSSTNVGSSANNAWGVDFNSGNLDLSLSRSSTFHVRLVRENQ